MSSASPAVLESPLDRGKSCQVRTNRVLAIKQTLVERYQKEGIAPAVVREAIAEAEAQAWLSGFPHLFLPGLADEILRHLQQKEGSIHPEYAQAA